MHLDSSVVRAICYIELTNLAPVDLEVFPYEVFLRACFFTELTDNQRESRHYWGWTKAEMELKTPSHPMCVN